MTKKKAIKLINRAREEKHNLLTDDIQYIIELSQEHPQWSVDRVFDEALKPKLRHVIVIYPSNEMNKALTKASKIYQLDIQHTIDHILRKYLKAEKLLNN